MENGEKLTITMVSESNFDNDYNKIEYTRTLNEEEGIMLPSVVEMIRDMLKSMGYSSESVDVVIDSGLDALEEWHNNYFGEKEGTTDEE